jgi:hypothetical protein
VFKGASDNGDYVRKSESSSIQRHLFARRERREALDPDIDADRFSRRMFDSFGFNLTCKTNVPAVRFSRDRTGFDFAFDGARQAHADRGNLAQI